MQNAPPGDEHELLRKGDQPQVLISDALIPDIANPYRCEIHFGGGSSRYTITFDSPEALRTFPAQLQSAITHYFNTKPKGPTP